MVKAFIQTETFTNIGKGLANNVAVASKAEGTYPELTTLLLKLLPFNKRDRIHFYTSMIFNIYACCQSFFLAFCAGRNPKISGRFVCHVKSSTFAPPLSPKRRKPSESRGCGLLNAQDVKRFHRWNDGQRLLKNWWMHWCWQESPPSNFVTKLRWSSSMPRCKLQPDDPRKNAQQKCDPRRVDRFV